MAASGSAASAEANATGAHNTNDAELAMAAEAMEGIMPGSGTPSAARAAFMRAVIHQKLFCVEISTARHQLLMPPRQCLNGAVNTYFHTGVEAVGIRLDHVFLSSTVPLPHAQRNQ